MYIIKKHVYVYVGDCFDKYISAATLPPQIKIPNSALSKSLPSFTLDFFHFIIENVRKSALINTMKMEEVYMSSS